MARLSVRLAWPSRGFFLGNRIILAAIAAIGARVGQHAALG